MNEHATFELSPSFSWSTRDEKLMVVAHWWAKQDAKCCICGEEMLPYKMDKTLNRDRATLEHLIPKRENGPNTVENVRLAHARCNHSLGSLYEINRHRIRLGLEPRTKEWALKHGGRVSADERLRPRAKRRRAAGISMEYVRPTKKEKLLKGSLARLVENGEIVSLPRGATLPKGTYEDWPWLRGLLDHARVNGSRMTALQVGYPHHKR